jgi:hypothetical protein
VLRVRLARRELDLRVQGRIRALDEELPALRRVGLLGLGRLRHLAARNPQQVAEGSRRQRSIQPSLNGLEPATEIVEVDVLGAPAAVVEEPQIRASLHGIVGDWQVGGHHLEQRKVKEFDQLRALTPLADVRLRV